jgi:hypothetical protein
MVTKRIIICSTLVSALLIAGTFLLVNSFAPLEKKNVLFDDSFEVISNGYENRSVWIETTGDYAASFNVSEGLIKFAPMLQSQFDRWLDGQFEPSWIETDQTVYGMGIGGQYAGYALYFVFVNNDTYTKAVHLEVAKVWKETNYISLFESIALILSGAIIGIGLKYSHKIQAA